MAKKIIVTIVSPMHYIIADEKKNSLNPTTHKVDRYIKLKREIKKKMCNQTVGSSALGYSIDYNNITTFRQVLKVILLWVFYFIPFCAK